MNTEEIALDRRSSCSATFDVTKRRKRITFFKLEKIWTFKHFFEDKEAFKSLADFYNEDKYRFEFKTFSERNNALKVLERMGFDYELVENLRGYVVKLDRFTKYAPILKNSVSQMGTPNSRIFLMKDLIAVEEALRLGAKPYEGDFGSLKLQ